VITNAWQRYVFRKDSSVDIHAYTFCMLDQLVTALHGSVATLQLPCGRLAGCSSWRLRFAVYSNGVKFEPGLILMAVGWYLRFSLSYRADFRLDYKLATLPFALVQAPLSSQPGGEKKLEVFAWWTSGGELFSVYNKQNPGIGIVNSTVAGGGEAESALHTRLTGGNPPDTWQSRPRWELLGDYVDPGYCEPVTELYKSDDWDRASRNLMTKDGNIYAVLVCPCIVQETDVLFTTKNFTSCNGQSGDRNFLGH
jgi:hypothetical protein